MATLASRQEPYLDSDAHKAESEITPEMNGTESTAERPATLGRKGRSSRIFRPRLPADNGTASQTANGSQSTTFPSVRILRNTLLTPVFFQSFLAKPCRPCAGCAGSGLNEQSRAGDAIARWWRVAPPSGQIPGRSAPKSLRSVPRARFEVCTAPVFSSICENGTRQPGTCVGRGRAYRPRPGPVDAFRGVVPGHSRHINPIFQLHYREPGAGACRARILHQLLRFVFVCPGMSMARRRTTWRAGTLRFLPGSNFAWRLRHSLPAARAGKTRHSRLRRQTRMQRQRSSVRCP